MARLKDIPRAVRAVGAWTLLKRIWQQIGEDHVTAWGASLAYSWLFALFPFLVFLLSLVPLLPERMKPNIRDDVGNVLEEMMSKEAAEPIVNQVDRLLKTENTGGFLSIGLLLTVYAASKGMSMTMAAIDKAYDVEKGRPFYKQQPLAIVLTIIVATLVVLLLILLPVGSGIVFWLKQQAGGLNWMLSFINVARYSIAMLLMFGVLAIIYHFGPSFRQRFVAITPGAIFCVAVWLLLGLLFKLYLTKLGGAAKYSQTYGAVAGAAILLLFFYLDALVLLVGAEINSEIDLALGRAPHRTAAAVPETSNSVKPEQPSPPA